MKRIFSTVVALSMVILTSVHTLAEENDINRTAIDEAKQYLSGDVTIFSEICQAIQLQTERK